MIGKDIEILVNRFLSPNAETGGNSEQAIKWWAKDVGSWRFGSSGNRYHTDVIQELYLVAQEVLKEDR